MESQKKRVLIAGGYGHVGTNIARLIRKEYPSIQLVLAGRNPQHGEQLCKELGNAETAYLDLGKDFNLQEYGAVDLIIAAMQDYNDTLTEAAVVNGIAHIGITKLSEDVSPLLFLSLHKAPSAPIVLAGHWQAGIVTLAAKHAAAQFEQITKVETACVYDQLDPIGPMIVAQMDDFVGRALIRQHGKWEFVEGPANPRSFQLHKGGLATGYPLGTLDVPSLAAVTGSPDIRFDIVMGKSIGSISGSKASHDLYIDIEGVLLSGKKARLRTVVSDPDGQSHLTSLGVLLSMEGIFGLGGQSAPEKGGVFLPETILSATVAIARLKEFGITIIQMDTPEVNV